MGRREGNVWASPSLTRRMLGDASPATEAFNRSAQTRSIKASPFADAKLTSHIVATPSCSPITMRLPSGDSANARGVPRCRNGAPTSACVPTSQIRVVAPEPVIGQLATKTRRRRQRRRYHLSSNRRFAGWRRPPRCERSTPKAKPPCQQQRRACYSAKTPRYMMNSWLWQRWCRERTLDRSANPTLVSTSAADRREPEEFDGRHRLKRFGVH
jgi:hypothetical protein